MTDEQMREIMKEIKAKMGHEVEACQGDIPEAMVSKLVTVMANDIEILASGDSSTG